MILDLACKNNHHFITNIHKLRLNEWCEICLNNYHSNSIGEILKKYEYEYNLYDSSLEGLIFLISTEYRGNVYYFDYEINSNANKLQEIVEKIEKIKELDNKFYILINEEIVKQNILEEFIVNSIYNMAKITIYNMAKITIYNTNKIKISIDDKISKVKNNLMNIYTNNNSYGYGRISSCGISTQIHSIETQKMLIRNYSKENKLNLVKIFIDEGKSGENIKRPALLKLIDSLKYGDHVIIYSLSRLSRDINDSFNLQKIIKDKQCKLIIIDSPFITGNEALDEFIITLSSSLDCLERKRISKRVSDTMNAHSSVKGIRPKTSFGEKFVAKKVAFIKDDYEQYVIDRIRELRNTLLVPTYTNIIKGLDAEGLRPRQKKIQEIKQSDEPDVDYGNDYDTSTKKEIKDSKWYPYKIKRIMEKNNIPLPKIYEEKKLPYDMNELTFS